MAELHYIDTLNDRINHSWAKKRRKKVKKMEKKNKGKNK